MGIVQSQSIAGGHIGTPAAAAAQKLSFSTHRVGDVMPAELNNANHAADPAQAAAFGLNPTANTGVSANKKKTGGVDIYKLADFMGQYGPSGFNTLADSQLTMLTAYANAVAEGRVGAGGATNLVVKLMTQVATSSASRSAVIVEDMEGTLGNGGGSGAGRTGYAPTYPYGSGSTDPVGSQPPSLDPILKNTLQGSDPQTDPEAGSAEETEAIMSGGAETVVSEETASALLTSDGAQAIDPMSDRLTSNVRSFLSSAANRAAAGAYMAQFSSTRRTRG